MIAVHPLYITDTEGEKLSVILGVHEFKSIMEELEDIRLYGEAKAAPAPSIPIDEAFKLIEAKRQSKK